MMTRSNKLIILLEPGECRVLVHSSQYPLWPLTADTHVHYHLITTLLGIASSVLSFGMHMIISMRLGIPLMIACK